MKSCLVLVMAPSIGFVGALSYPIEGASAKMEGEGTAMDGTQTDRINLIEVGHEVPGAAVFGFGLPTCLGRNS